MCSDYLVFVCFIRIWHSVDSNPWRQDILFRSDSITYWHNLSKCLVSNHKKKSEWTIPHTFSMKINIKVLIKMPCDAVKSKTQETQPQQPHKKTLNLKPSIWNLRNYNTTRHFECKRAPIKKCKFPTCYWTNLFGPYKEINIAAILTCFWR